MQHVPLTAGCSWHPSVLFRRQSDGRITSGHDAWWVNTAQKPRTRGEGKTAADRARGRGLGQREQGAGRVVSAGMCEPPHARQPNIQQIG
jgi:hypothetical protein